MSLDYMNPTYRHSDKTRRCRACDSELPKGVPAVMWWSGFNGGHLVLCKKCVVKMNDMVNGDPLPVPPRP